MADHELILLAHLIGDSSYLEGQPLRYTTASEANSSVVTEAALKLGSVINRHAGRGKWHQLLIGGNGDRWHPAGVGKWLKDIGVFDTRSARKRVPDVVFRSVQRAGSSFSASSLGDRRLRARWCEACAEGVLRVSRQEVG